MLRLRKKNPVAYSNLEQLVVTYCMIHQEDHLDSIHLQARTKHSSLTDRRRTG